MFAKSVTILAAVMCMQVCSGMKHFTDYESCLADYDLAISHYKTYFVKFEQTREDSRNRAIQVISEALAKRTISSECLKVFPNQTAEFYNQRTFKVCGGITEDMELYRLQILETKEQTCGRLITYSPELIVLRNHNEKVEKECDFLETFEEHFGKNLDACQENQ